MFLELLCICLSPCHCSPPGHRPHLPGLQLANVSLTSVLPLTVPHLQGGCPETWVRVLENSSKMFLWLQSMVCTFVTWSFKVSPKSPSPAAPAMPHYVPFLCTSVSWRFFFCTFALGVFTQGSSIHLSLSLFFGTYDMKKLWIACHFNSKASSSHSCPCDTRHFCQPRISGSCHTEGQRPVHICDLRRKFLVLFFYFQSLATPHCEYS